MDLKFARLDLTESIFTPKIQSKMSENIFIIKSCEQPYFDIFAIKL